MLLGGGICSALVYYGGRHLLPGQSATWAVGIMGSSVTQGFINRAASDSVHPIQLSVLGCLVLSGLAYVVARNILLPRISAGFKPADALVDSTSSLPSLKLYGTTFFALIVAAGLLVFRARDFLDSLLPFAIPLAVLGLLISTIGCGFTRQNFQPQQSERTRTTSSSDSAQWWHVLSSACVILGGVLTVSACFAANDNVQFVIGIAIACGLASGGLALLFQQPALTAICALGVSAGTLLGGHLLSGNISLGPVTADSVEHIATHGLTGVIFLVLAVAWGLGGWWLGRLSATGEKRERETGASLAQTQTLRPTHTLVMLASAGVLALMSVLVAGYGAFTATAMTSMCLAITVLLCGAFAGLIYRANASNGLPMVLGSGLIFIVCATMLLRSNNPVASLLGVTAWEMPWRILAALLSHAVIVTAARVVLTFSWPTAGTGRQYSTDCHSWHLRSIARFGTHCRSNGCRRNSATFALGRAKVLDHSSKLLGRHRDHLRPARAT